MPTWKYAIALTSTISFSLMFPLSVCEFVPLLLVLCVILITLLLGSQAILAPLSEMQAEDEEKTIGFQTTHLPKFHTITYSLKNQLCLI